MSNKLTGAINDALPVDDEGKLFFTDAGVAIYDTLERGVRRNKDGRMYVNLGLNGGSIAAYVAAQIAANPSGIHFANAGGSADALTAAITPTVTTLTDGAEFIIVAGAANATTTPTLAIDATGAKTIVKNGDLPLVAGDIVGAGHVLLFYYRTATGHYELANPAYTAELAVKANINTPVLNAAAGGTVNALTAAIGITSLVDGAVFLIVASGANTTTTPTLAIDATGAKIIVKVGDLPLIVGDIVGAGHVLLLYYRSSTGHFELTNPGSADLAIPLRYVVAGGTSDALTATVSPAPTAITISGMQFLIQALSANTTATPTVNINGLGAKTIVKNGSLPLVAGDIAGTGHELILCYRSGIDSFELLNPAYTAELALKADLASPALTGNPTTPTAAAGDNDTSIANTAFATAILARSSSAGGSTGYITGLCYRPGTDAVNDINIDIGQCADTTGADVMLVPYITKQLDASWAVGTNAGGLDTGSIGNSDYYMWVIKRVDTGVVDALFSLSSTAPTMPTNYTLKRLVGWFKRVGGTIVAFNTYELSGGGIELLWTTPTRDIALAATLTTSRRTDAVKVPLNFSVIARLFVIALDGAAAFGAIIQCPDQTDAAPDPTGAGAPGANIFQSTIVAGTGTGICEINVRTSSTGTIAARATIATVDTYVVLTQGFQWARRN